MKKCLKPLVSFKQKIKNELSKRQFEFKYLSIAISHGHELFEIALKPTEKQLKTVVQYRKFKRLNTVFTKIKTILNSQPLKALSADFKSINFFTSVYSLIGKAMTDVPESLKQVIHTLKFEEMKQLTDYFWHFFKYDYINIIQKRFHHFKQKDDAFLWSSFLIKGKILHRTCWF